MKKTLGTLAGEILLLSPFKFRTRVVWCRGVNNTKRDGQTDSQTQEVQYGTNKIRALPLTLRPANVVVLRATENEIRKKRGSGDCCAVIFFLCLNTYKVINESSAFERCAPLNLLILQLFTKIFCMNCK